MRSSRLQAIAHVAPERVAASCPQEVADGFLVAAERDGAADVDVQPRATCHIHPMGMLLIPAAAAVRDLDPAAIRSRLERGGPCEPHLHSERSEVRSQKSDVRPCEPHLHSKRSEVRRQKSDARPCEPHLHSKRSDVLLPTSYRYMVRMVQAHDFSWRMHDAAEVGLKVGSRRGGRGASWRQQWLRRELLGSKK